MVTLLKLSKLVATFKISFLKFLSYSTTSLWYCILMNILYKKVQNFSSTPSLTKEITSKSRSSSKHKLEFLNMQYEQLLNLRFFYFARKLMMINRELWRRAILIRPRNHWITFQSNQLKILRIFWTR